MRLYLDLKGYGICNEKGRASGGVSIHGRIVGEPNRPVRSVILPLLNELMPLWRYSADEECHAEIAALKEWVAGLEHESVTPAPAR